MLNELIEQCCFDIMVILIFFATHLAMHSSDAGIGESRMPAFLISCLCG